MNWFKRFTNEHRLTLRPIANEGHAGAMDYAAQQMGHETDPLYMNLSRCIVKLLPTTDPHSNPYEATLEVYDLTNPEHPIIVLRFDDATSYAQWFAEKHLENLGLKREDSLYKRRLKAIRKALGYSYP